MLSVTFRGLSYEIPGVDEFTNGEMMEIERISGFTADQIFTRIVQKQALPYAVTIAIGYMAMRRAGATLTLEEILAAPLTEMSWDNGETDEPEPEVSTASPLPEIEDGGDTDTSAALDANGSRSSGMSSERSPAT